MELRDWSRLRDRALRAIRRRIIGSLCECVQCMGPTCYSSRPTTRCHTLSPIYAQSAAERSGSQKVMAR